MTAANAYRFWQGGVTLDPRANNSINGASGYDLLWRGGGCDTLSGCAGPNTLIGGCGNDSLADGDSLMRGWGADTLQEGGGHETLIGGQGYDLLAGGAGVDTFAFHTGNGGKRIAGYQIGIDRLMIGNTVLPRSVPRFSIKDVHKTALGVVIDFANENRITIEGRGIAPEAIANDILRL